MRTTKEKLSVVWNNWLTIWKNKLYACLTPHPPKAFWTEETSHLTSYCLDCISMHCMLIWVKEARHTMIMCFVRIIECSCWSPSWLYTNVPSYECTTRFFWNCYIYLCQIERCGVRKPHGNSGREWGLSKCTDSEDEEKWAYLERDLGVKIYRTWDQLIGWGDEEYRQHG